MRFLDMSKESRMTLLHFNRYMAKLNELQSNYELLKEPIVCGMYGFNEVDIEEIHQLFINFMSYYYLMSDEEQEHIQYKLMIEKLKNKSNYLIGMLEIQKR